MRKAKNVTGLAAAIAMAILGGTAQASVLNVTASGGSEAVLTIINTGNGSTISQDIGDQIGELAIGDNFALDTSVLSFISSAGGLPNVRFSLVAGQSTGGTAAATYLASSAFASYGPFANGTKGTWFSTLNGFINQLNGTNPGDTDGTVDGVYGAFNTGAQGNYLSGASTGTDYMADWGVAGTCPTNTPCNLGALGSATVALWRVGFGSGTTGTITPTRFLNDGQNGGAIARLDLANSKLVIEAVNQVPVPAAVWLLGSAVGLLGAVRRRQQG